MKCKDLFIIKAFKEKSPTQSIDFKLISDNIKLKWDIIEHFTNKSEEFWTWNYMIETYNCAFEEIYENHKIIFDDNRRSFLFYIPKDKEKEYNELINIIKSHGFKYKILKKTFVSFIDYVYNDETDLYFNRKQSHDYSKKTKAFKIWSREKKLERIIDEN